MNAKTIQTYRRMKDHFDKLSIQMDQMICIHLKELGLWHTTKIRWLINLFIDRVIDPISEKILLSATGGIMQKRSPTLHITIKHGIMLYCMLAVVAVPSGICSRQHHIPDYKMSVLAQILPDHNMPTARDPQEQQIDVAALETPSAVVDSPLQDDEAPLELLPFHEYIMKAAENYNVDPALIRAMIQAESSYNPLAISKRGAQGLMQLMPITAKSLGVEDSFDPALNIDGGVRYFKKLLDRFGGDEALALAAYNAGSRYVRKYKGVPPFRATKIYIKKVLEYREQLGKEAESPGELASAF